MRTLRSPGEGSDASRPGFTIMELIVVIGIVAVLAAIVVLSLVDYISRAEVSACELEVNGLQKAVGAYLYQSDGTWPTEAGSLPGALDYDKLVPYYIDKVPLTEPDCGWYLTDNGMVFPSSPATCPCD